MSKKMTVKQLRKLTRRALDYLYERQIELEDKLDRQAMVIRRLARKSASD